MKKIASVLSALALSAGLLVGTADPSQALDLDLLRQKVIDKVEAARDAKCGNGSMKWSDGLTDSAQYHSNEMALDNYVGYDSRFPAENWGHRISRISGFNNLIDEVVVGGVNAPGSAQQMIDYLLTPNTERRKTTLNCKLKVMGVGYKFYAPSGTFWTLDFSDKVVIFTQG